MIRCLFTEYFSKFQFTYQQTDELEEIRQKLGTRFDPFKAAKIIKDRGQDLSFILEVALEQWDCEQEEEPDICMYIC